MPNRPDFPRLYAILDADVLAARAIDPLGLVDTWISGGVRLVQLRAKTLAGGAFLELARALAGRVRAAGGTFIVNDRADIAAMAGASGVHVGQGDLTPAAARRVVGPAAMVGLSTHTDEQARRAVTEPVDYLAIGPVFATATKGPDVDPTVGVEGVARAAAIARTAGLPLVGIGGITAERAAAVLAAGATSIAVVSDLIAGDPAVRLGAYQRALGI